MLAAHELLRLPAEEAARWIAQSRLEATRAAAERLLGEGDERSLHEFRVALRRLRAALASWRRELGAAARARLRAKLRALQRESGPGRDAEVALEWLAGLRTPRGARASVPGALRDELRLRLARTRALVPRLAKRFQHLDAWIAPRLKRVCVEYELGAPTTGGCATRAAAHLRSAARRLDRRLALVVSVSDASALHRARIAGKRLRYLVETFSAAAPELAALEQRLVHLQRVLGELQDAHVLARELEHFASADEPARGRRSARSGAALGARLDQRQAALWAEFEQGDLGAQRLELAQLAERAAAALETLAGTGLEIERRFLLSGMPNLPEGAEVLEIEQGWLPGERLRERLRRVRGPQGTQHVRSLKAGAGLVRFEVEESISSELWDGLWPWTEALRIHKRRYRVRCGAHTFEIDQFEGRELVLAEVELAHASESCELPDWLQARVVAEVTGLAQYTNYALARAWALERGAAFESTGRGGG